MASAAEAYNFAAFKNGGNKVYIAGSAPKTPRVPYACRLSGTWRVNPHTPDAQWQQVLNTNLKVLCYAHAGAFTLTDRHLSLQLLARSPTQRDAFINKAYNTSTAYAQDVHIYTAQTLQQYIAAQGSAQNACAQTWNSALKYGVITKHALTGCTQMAVLIRTPAVDKAHALVRKAARLGANVAFVQIQKTATTHVIAAGL